jgi:hypothetical protein
MTIDEKTRKEEIQKVIEKYALEAYDNGWDVDRLLDEILDGAEDEEEKLEILRPLCYDRGPGSLYRRLDTHDAGDLDTWALEIIKKCIDELIDKDLIATYTDTPDKEDLNPEEFYLLVKGDYYYEDIILRLSYAWEDMIDQHIIKDLGFDL